MMQITVNGAVETVANEATVAGVLGTLGLAAAATVVERNGAIVPRDSYGETVLTEGDILELVRVVGGG